MFTLYSRGRLGRSCNATTARNLEMWPTDGRTDGPTDTVRCRVACPWLKMCVCTGSKMKQNPKQCYLLFQYRLVYEWRMNGRTDGQTNVLWSTLRWWTLSTDYLRLTKRSFDSIKIWMINWRFWCIIINWCNGACIKRSIGACIKRSIDVHHGVENCSNGISHQGRVGGQILTEL